MTLKDELYALFNEGKTPSECINLGYKRPTVYRFLKDYNMEKEKERIKTLIDESELIKKAFQGFKENKNLIDMVIDYGVSPDRLRELYAEYTKLGEIETQYQEKLKGLNEVLRIKEEAEAYLKQLEPKLGELQGKLREIIDSKANIDLKTYLQWRLNFLEDELDTAMIERAFSKQKDFYIIDDEAKSRMEREFSLVEKYLREQGQLNEKVPPCTGHKVTCVLK